MKHFFRIILFLGLAAACFVLADSLVPDAARRVIWDDGTGLWPFVPPGPEVSPDEAWGRDFHQALRLGLLGGVTLVFLWYVISRFVVNHTHWSSAGARGSWWVFFVLTVIAFAGLLFITPGSPNVRGVIALTYSLVLPIYFFLSTLLFSAGGAKYAAPFSVHIRRHIPWL